MLKSLQIKNYVLIDSLDVEFPEGLVIISGQTGAGKSILLGALSLLLGSKADASVIGGEADSCVVEAVFGIPETDMTLRNILEENEVEPEDGELIIRRVVNRSGRSRSFINDSPVNIQILQSILKACGHPFPAPDPSAVGQGFPAFHAGSLRRQRGSSARVRAGL